MKNKSKAGTLECYFRRKAIRWALIGLGLTLIFAVPCILFSAKVSSERQILSTAKSTVRAFRPMILEEDIRDVEFQMRNALDLKPLESATIYDTNLNAIYPLKTEEQTARCRIPNTFCWSKTFRILSVLQPIYFDDEKKEKLFGYLELRLVPDLDLSILSVLAFLLLIAFIVQAFGLSSALNQSADQIVDQLGLWANHLRTTPSERPEIRQKVPFSELKPMQEAVDGLYLEIEKLREKTAKHARTEAQEIILREIGHDLKTPHSQLAKYFALLIDTVRTTGQLKESEVSNVERTLKRMGQLLRNVLIFSFGKNANKDSNSLAMPSSLKSETESILEDFRNDPAVISKGIEINESLTDIGYTVISKLGYYRILENLLRNAIEAAPTEGGKISVTLSTLNGFSTLVVQDNGSGISKDIIHKIFDFDFTTKPERGTGLGLGIVNKICTEFGSEISVKSEKGEGTTFIVSFRALNKELALTQTEEVMHGEV